MAFVTDVYSRRIIGWQTTYRPVCTDLALDALKIAVWQRKRTGANLTGLVHHLRPWGAVQVYSLRAGPVRLRGGRLGEFQGRLLSASPWPRHSTRCTRPSSSVTRDPGRTSTPSSTPPLSWSTGRTPFTLTPPSGCKPPSTTQPPGSPTSARTARNNHNRKPPAPDKPASTKPWA